MFKSKVPEKDKDTAAHAAEAVERALQQQHSVVEEPPPRRQPTTVEEPPPTRHPATNAGPSSCIFHRSLSIDESSLFEGSSRRVENPTDLPGVDAKGPKEEDMRGSALARYLQRAEASASTEWSESTAEPKH